MGVNAIVSLMTISVSNCRVAESALAAHSASEPFVKNVAIINDCGEMKIEKFQM